MSSDQSEELYSMQAPSESRKLPFQEETIEALTRTLPSFLYTRRWFGSKARRIGAVRIVDSVPIPSGSSAMLLFIRVKYDDGGMETYQLPVIAAIGEEAERVRRDCPQAVLAPLVVRKDDREHAGLIYEALWSCDFSLALLQAIGRGNRFQGSAGSLIASSTKVFAELVPTDSLLKPAVMQGEQSNTSVAFGERVILKLFRRLEQGISLDFEIGLVLTNRQFRYVPPIAGVLEYQDNSGTRITLGLLQKFVANDGDAWRYSLEAVGRFFELTGREGSDARPPDQEVRLLDLAREDYSPLARRLIGEYLESAQRLGLRTAQLHLALSEVVDDPAFAPEPLTREYRKSQHESMVQGLADALALVKERMELLSTSGQADARQLFDFKPALDRIFDSFRDLKTPVPLIRCHGDYHLGQVLCTGGDFMIIDFEGEPARSLAERRMKQPAVVDVAGMVRSFHYAPFAFLKDKGLEHSLWASFWSTWSSAAFLKGYLGAATGAPFWPQAPEDVGLLMDVYLIKKALYELQYELNNRPDWVEIPLHGLVETLKATGNNKL